MEKNLAEPLTKTETSFIPMNLKCISIIIFLFGQIVINQSDSFETYLTILMQNL